MKTILTSKMLGVVLCIGMLPMLPVFTGCAGDRYHQSTGEAIDDHGISMRVKDALSNDAEYKYEGVNVVTFKGDVQLSGFVDTHAQKGRAASIAKSIEGVKDVENNITVKD
ncbi:MAG TPA: BON domain-containing protein [Candidatus Sulfotelmatobacter sp.]|nr:BON domain-containing protein [Candidatus Sulfotelmatobacter sp.]